MEKASLLRRFRTYGSKLKPKLNGYSVDLDYLEPPISPREGCECVKEMLLFFPSKRWPPIRKPDGTLYFEKSLVLSVLRIVYFQVYADSFQDDPNLDRAYRKTLLNL